MRPIFLKVFSILVMVILAFFMIALFTVIGVVVYKLGMYVINDASELFVMCLGGISICLLILLLSVILNYGRTMVSNAGSSKVEDKNNFPI